MTETKETTIVGVDQMIEVNVQEVETAKTMEDLTTTEEMEEEDQWFATTAKLYVVKLPVTAVNQEQKEKVDKKELASNGKNLNVLMVTDADLLMKEKVDVSNVKVEEVEIVVDSEVEIAVKEEKWFAIIAKQYVANLLVTAVNQELKEIVEIEAELREEEDTTEEISNQVDHEEFAFNSEMVTVDMVIDVDSYTKTPEEAETEVDQVVVVKEAGPYVVDDPDLTVEVKAPEGQEDQEDPDPQRNPDQDLDLEMLKEIDPEIEVTREKTTKRKEVEVEVKVTAARMRKMTGDRAGMFD